MPKYFLLLLLNISLRLNARPTTDSAAYDVGKIYGFALDANISSVLEILRQPVDKPLALKSAILKEKFLQRFGFDIDQSSYMESRQSGIDDILLVYRDYWRISMLNSKHNYDSVLLKSLGAVLSLRYNLTEPLKRDSLELYFKKAITSEGFYTTPFGKTGRLFDLLVWKHQYDTAYTFNVKKEKITAPIVFMDDFLTLGWSEYATLDRNYPGGWATKDSLFAVKKAYKLDSENFLISYLAHEGKHFSDYKLFPKLSGIDLEYRAKLIELSLAKEGLYRIIEFFTKNSGIKSTNPHTVANYYVLRDLSRTLFEKEFETDMQLWKSINSETINKAAYKLYKKNTKNLRKAGSSKIIRYIK